MRSRRSIDSLHAQPASCDSGVLSTVTSHLRSALVSAMAAGISDSDYLVQRTIQDLKLHRSQEVKNQLRMDLSRIVAETEVITTSISGTLSLEELRNLKERLSDEVAQAKQGGLSEKVICQAETHRRRLHNVIEDLKGQIRVFCRIRPLSEKEMLLGDT